jgi:hypothetical protein
MRKSYFAIASILFIFSACTKTTISKPTRDPINEPPLIKIISANNSQPLKPYDQLTIKAEMTDIDLIAVASWEALNAAAACGPNQHKDSFTPMVYDFELNFSFTIPPFFPGNHKIRLYGVDGSGNIAITDIPYTATN